jgi:hypothetical protein
MPIPVISRLVALLLSLAVVPKAQIIVSEVMADPSALADAQGEFLELANAGARPEGGDQVRLVLDGDTLGLGPLTLAPGGHWLACRDSAALTSAGVRCDRSLPALSLANTRPLRAAVLWGEFRSAFEIPAARPGVSWENTWDDARGLLAFARSGKAFLSGDSATPGARNSRSLRPAAHDFVLAGARIAGGGTLEVTVASRGRGSRGGGLSVRLDRDWDGSAETFLDSLPVEPGGGTLRLPLGPDDQGILVATLAPDEDPSGDVLRLHRGGGRTLELTEACPAPEAGPEWVEVRNATGDGGGIPRRLHLARVEWEGRPLGPAAGVLDPGEHLLLAEDAEALRAALGPLKVRILEPPAWGSLRNTGDTVRLALEGAGLDSLVYGYKEAAAATCLARSFGPDGAATALPQASPTPGYPSPETPARASLRIAPKVIGRGNPAGIEVEIPDGGTYGLRVFDLEGNVRRVLARGGPGRHALSWGGEGERGNRLPPGPYIVALTVGSGAPLRSAVVLAEER